jgi:sterol desaturase/sphingolipid hydroxylase (fatty acid hydroxylase superfamily)
MSPFSHLWDRWVISFERLFLGEAWNFVWVLAAFALLTAVELLIPAQAGHRWTGRARNLAYAAIYLPLGLAALSLWYALIEGRGDPQRARLESVMLLPVYLFVGDLAYYWYHRAQHRFEPLWAIHELHHADTELNVTTSYRTYWLEAPVQSILVASPALLIFGGVAPALGLLAMIMTRCVLLFAHSNLRLPLGPLTLVVCGPQWHRIHHSALPQHADKNFAQLFPFIDWMFGTYYAPAPHEYPPTGTAKLRSDESLGRALSRPFAIWRDEIVALFRAGRRRGDPLAPPQ